MSEHPRDVCACGHARWAHLYGLCCVGCQRCWWFRLAERCAWELVRFECGCTRYVDAKVEFADAHCRLHEDARGVEVVG